MMFVPPSVHGIRLAKGEFFTRRDVPCLRCEAEPGELCRVTHRHHCAAECCHCERAAVYEHSMRCHLYKAWSGELLAQRMIKKVRVPFGLPEWARFYDTYARDYVALLVVKSIKPPKRTRKESA